MELNVFRLSLYQPGGPMGVLYPVDDLIVKTRSRFQEIEVLVLRGFGKTLVLDGLIQSTEKDEYIYHESLVHPAMLLHPSPRRVLILGGGEGATLREVLKHPSVEDAVMVDIDEVVVEVSKKYLPEWHQGAFEDPRAKVVIMDGFEYVKRSVESGEAFDIVIMDLTDPYGSEVALKLYTKEAFTLIRKVMTRDGVLVVQAGSSTLFPEAFDMVRKAVLSVFSRVYEYNSWVPSFSYMNSFLIASDVHDFASLSSDVVNARIRERKLSLRFINGDRVVAMRAFAGIRLA